MEMDALRRWSNSLFTSFLLLWSKEKKSRKSKHLLWHCACWNLWKMRNNIAFQNQAYDGQKLLEDSKIIAWQWFLYTKRSQDQIFISSWLQESILCWNSFE
ncbi:hypothetical protein AAZX31_17G025100 [Glycine max]|nr:hypothetical protein GLYMA_17G025950v4 [Glycine max]KAH1116425.1 hypothetical protein GYH30_046035 [Glycine max]